jgi:hypothetical protein
MISILDVVISYCYVGKICSHIYIYITEWEKPCDVLEREKLQNRRDGVTMANALDSYTS